MDSLEKSSVTVPYTSYTSDCVTLNGEKDPKPGIVQKKGIIELSQPAKRITNLVITKQ